MRYNKIKTLFIFLICVFTAVQIGAEGNTKDKDARLSKTAGSPSRTHFNINNVSTWIYNNGDSDIKPDGNSGFIFPKGSNLAAIFESGFVWGASVDGELRVGGSTYSQGLLPGRVLPNGQREVGVTGDKVRIFRVRTDYVNGDLSAEVADGEGTADEIRAQYAKDWTEWPAEYGAPYEDVDGNGVYNVDTDIPGFPGADQTIWYVANDLDTSTCRSLYGSDPMGIEIQATFWGYKSSSALGNTMFRKFTIINKSATTFEDMYVSMWSDPDVGDAGDDFSGCDVEKSLMFTYNGDNDDATYGATPPAVGFDFFQGPIVPAPGEVAIFNNAVKPDFKNLPMSVHYFFINGDEVYNDPDLGEYVTGTLQFHNLFNGLITTSGSPFVDPTTGEQTKFTLAGDPVTGQGWVDGILHPPGDRRQGMVAGPFDMAAGEVQEVVVATIAAGAFGVVDRLGAVQLLKFYDQEAQSAYDNFFQIPKSPLAPTIAISELDEEIVLTWDDATSEEIEAYDDLGYKFQGYVVYQYPSKSAPFEDAKLVKTYDLIDGIAKVIGPQFDIAGGVVLDKVLKFGTDEGVKRSISLKTDLFSGSAPLNNGTPYYYAVTSYVVNENLAVVPNILESELLVKEVVPQNIKPGAVIEGKYGESLAVAHDGTANATVSVSVANPMAVTGDDYQLFFDAQHYYLDKDGIWKETAYEDSVGKSLSKPGDQGPSTLVPLVSIFAPNQTLDVHFMVENNAPDFNWIDGVSITFPAGIVINSANVIHSNHDASPVIDGQTVTWGESGVFSQDGPFVGGEDLMVNINFTEPTFTVDYVIFDDGWAEANDSASFALGNGTVDGVGSVTLTGETGYQFKTEQHWNVKNTTTNTVVLDDQRVFGGVNVYTQENVGADAAKMFEGLTATVVGSFEAPITFLGTEFTVDADPTDGDLSLWGDLQLFGDATGFWFEEGSTTTVPSIEAAQPDLQFRFTGVADDNDSPVTAGGQWTTQWERGAFGANDMTGLNNVQIRVPFEIWDIESNTQLEVVVINRNADGASPYANDVGAPGEARWRITGRDYIIILNKPYTDDPALRRDLNDESATWCVFFTQAGGSVWSPGDVYTLFYANPLQLGVDSFNFKAPVFGYDATQAATDVKEVNVFPNPYYGVNPNEINKYQRFVTFNHLPPKATIRLFNLGGQLVKTIEKEDQSQFQKWNLTNENGLPIASGVYIAYIDMPELGKTKILKVAIIQETQILDRF